MFIQGSQPYAQELTITATVKNKMNTYISADEAIEIVSYLYSKHDAEMLIARINDNLEFISTHKDPA